MTQTNQALVEYSREIGPRVRAIEAKKQALKDFKETDQKAIELTEAIKTANESAKAELKSYIESENADLIEEIKELEKELKEAIKGAARATKDTDRPFTAGELKPYFVARNKTVEQGKPKPVDVVINKGGTFTTLEQKIGKD